MKSCGDCGLCCKLMGVHELAKPPARWCGHSRRRSGCSIYDTRPTACRVFNCTWLLTDALDDVWKPSAAGFVLHNEDKGRRLIVECDPARPHAWRREPYLSRLRGWAAGGTVEILIFAGARGVRLTRDADTPVRRA